MSLLSDILSSRVRGRHPATALQWQATGVSYPSIERKSTVTFNAIRQELKKLSGLDLVNSRRDGNRLCYRANSNHPLYPVLSELVAKTVGFKALLKQVSLDG